MRARVTLAVAWVMLVSGCSCGGCSDSPSSEVDGGQVDLAPEVSQGADGGDAWVDASTDGSDAVGTLDLVEVSADDGVNGEMASEDVPSDGDGGDAGPMSCVPLPPVREGHSVVHCSAVAQWEVHDPAVYQANQAGFDEIIALLDGAYPALLARLGRPLALPLRVLVEPGECCSSFTSLTHTGFADGDFIGDTGLTWTRGVLLATVVNAAVNSVSRGWPADWWMDSGAFTGLVTADLLGELTTPAIASAWEAQEEYPSSAVYRALKGLLEETGWPLFEQFFYTLVDESIDWTLVGENPSPLRTNYVIAYLSVAMGRNLGATFSEARVAGADPALVQAIIDARAALKLANQQGKDTAARWSAFRMGDYLAAVQGL